MSPLVAHVLAIVEREAGSHGHLLGAFRSKEDTYTSECSLCGAPATVTCSIYKYEKLGGAFASRCEAGILRGMSSLLVRGLEVATPSGLVVENFNMAGVVRFKNAPRTARVVSEVILHETVTTSVRATVDVLQQRGLGVHIIIGPDGIIHQHGDLFDDELWHASQHNGPSVGIEVVNPYYPRYRPTNSPWTTVIDAPWAHEGKYVVPTVDQAEACCQFTSWLCGENSDAIQVPRIWHGMRADGRMTFGLVPSAAKCSPGIYAHYYFGHCDGAWLALYCWLRMVAELSVDDAYLTAVTRATGARGSVDLSDLVRG